MDRNENGSPKDELLTAGRIVPVRREGNKIFVRSLRTDEKDTGEVVHVGPGDQVVIPPGELVIDSREIDAQSVKGLGGYAPVANTVWTWYAIVGEELDFFLFFFSLARRIDAAHALWALAMQERERATEESAIPRRARFFSTLATAEVAIIALYRGIKMARTLIDKFCPDLRMPGSVEEIRTAVQEMRHAFEHIDDRAEGRIGMSGKADPDALSIFHQPEFIESSLLRYKEHTLNFKDDVLAALLECRELIMEAIDSRAASRTPDGDLRIKLPSTAKLRL